MARYVVLSLLLLSGCQALQDKAVDYVSDLAIEKISSAVDKRLEDRGLSLAKIKTAADLDDSGELTKEEVFSTAKLAAQDLIALKLEQASGEAKKELEQKLASVASTRDLGELKAAADSQDLFGKGTLMALLMTIMGYATKQVFSAKSDAKRDERIAVMEQLLKRDLDGDGVVGPAAPKA